MFISNKGALVKLYSTAYKSLFTAIIVALFAMSFPIESIAQTKSSKPKLAEILLGENNTSKKAENIVKHLINNKPNVTKKIDNEHFNARFIPINNQKNNDRFIFAKFENPEFGGCYNSGCHTIIYYNKENTNNWSIVFMAFAHRSFYDSTSNKNKHANLIFSSRPDGRNPGIWMWDGINYKLVNKK